MRQYASHPDCRATPIRETALELIGIEGCEDIAEMIM
jgi:hypothetical protein